MEAGRSVSGISYSQERRSLGWKWKDPSRGNSYSQERRALGWRRKDPSRKFLIPRRWNGKFLFPGEAVTGLEAGRSVSEEAVIGLEAERSVSEISYSQRRFIGLEAERSVSGIFFIPRRGGQGGKIRLEKILIIRTGGHWVGGGKIRLGDPPRVEGENEFLKNTRQVKK